MKKMTVIILIIASKMTEEFQCIIDKNYDDILLEYMLTLEDFYADYLTTLA